MRGRVIFSNDVPAAVDQAVGTIAGVNRVFIVADENTARVALPLIAGAKSLTDSTLITIPAGDEAKTVATLQDVWRQLQASGATRHSLVINLGGGVVTDLGGFAAATFKRGMRFINIPTTVLAAVDAAVGGKTGVNFGNMKNEIGAFAPADAVILSAVFFDTLPAKEFLSGLAEMMKHAMLTSDDDVADLMRLDYASLDHDLMLQLLRRSVAVKERIVEQDPLEKGVRRALNLGHTAGHAFESMALERMAPVAHGYAVAWGLVTEAVLSHSMCQFPSAKLYPLAHWVKENFLGFDITCDDYDRLIELMRHDKKSRNGEINCTLLRSYGDFSIDNIVGRDAMIAALDITRDLLE